MNDDIKKKILEINKLNISNEEKNKKINKLFSSNNKETIENCKHYNINCAIYAECCNKFYSCRFCHNDNEDHEIDRFSIKTIKCKECNTIQKKSNQCINCNIIFANKYCEKCNLWTDSDTDIFHCDKCKICRVGKREDYYHCDNCNVCFHNNNKNNHICSSINTNKLCVICQENLQDSLDPIIISKCNHPIHSKCLNNLLKNNNYKCPICKKSLIDMKTYWEQINNSILLQPMPSEYKKNVKIKCYDCDSECFTEFHFLGLKCKKCYGFNTVES